jgi:hypothetical protein
MSSNFSIDASVVFQHTPDEYERTSYYNGVTGDDDHPELVYCSDSLTTPFPKAFGGVSGLPDSRVPRAKIPANSRMRAAGAGAGMQKIRRILGGIPGESGENSRTFWRFLREFLRRQRARNAHEEQERKNEGP